MRELDGIASLPSLEELYISFNEVSELSPLQFHESLQILDIEANLVEDPTEIENLASCPELIELTIEGNPVCKKFPNIFFQVKQCLPQLQILDSEVVAHITDVATAVDEEKNDSQQHKCAGKYDAVVQIINATDPDSAGISTHDGESTVL